LLLPLPLVPLPLMPLPLSLSEDSQRSGDSQLSEDSLPLPQPLDYPMLRQEDSMSQKQLPLEPQKGPS
jgi:hypothetical protein